MVPLGTTALYRNPSLQVLHRGALIRQLGQNLALLTSVRDVQFLEEIGQEMWIALPAGLALAR